MQTPNDRVIGSTQRNITRGDLLINSSIVDDRYRHTWHISNDPSLHNNYAPLNKMMGDTKSTRNIHPVARYLDTSVPYFHDMLYNDKIVHEIATGLNNAHQKINIEPVRLNGQLLQINRNVVTSSSVYPDRRYIDQVNDINKHINNVMNVKSGIKEVDARGTRQIEELKNTYPDNTEAIEAYDPLIGSSRNESNLECERSSGCFKESYSDSLIGTSRGPENIECERSSGCFNDIGSELQPSTNRNTYNKPKFVVRKEGYKRENKDDTYIDQVYIQALEARAKALCDYVKANKVYKPWMKAWMKMNKSLSQAGFTFSRLKDTDSDIAYTINKGQITRFRIRGKDYSYIPINISQYVLYHEMAHAANEKYGHGDEFCEKLAILCLAAYELGFINLKNIKKELYLTNEQPVLCQADMKGEITRGASLVMEANPEMTSHYKEFIEYIQRL